MIVLYDEITPSLCYTKDSKFNKQPLYVNSVTAWIDIYTPYRNILTITEMQTMGSVFHWLDPQDITK